MGNHRIARSSQFYALQEATASESGGEGWEIQCSNFPEGEWELEGMD